MTKNRTIIVQGTSITISQVDIDDYICITDMAAAKVITPERRMLLKTG